MNAISVVQTALRHHLSRFAQLGCLLACVLPAGLYAQTVIFPGIIPLGSGFNAPSGVAVDASGNVYVADTGNNAVKEMLAVGGIIPASPTILTLGSGFNAPHGVAVDASGDVWVADTGNNALKEMVAVDGSIPSSPTIKTVGSGFLNPYGVTVDASGNVWVADTGGNQAAEIEAVGGSIPASPTVRLLGSGFENPEGVAVDAKGNVYVANRSLDQLDEMEAVSGVVPNSPTIITLASGTFQPEGVVLDSSGNLYVAAPNETWVFEFYPPFGDGGQFQVLGFTAFTNPAGVALGSNGTIYVADQGANAVYEMVRDTNLGAVNLTSTSEPLSVAFTFTAGGSGISPVVLTEGTPGLEFADAGTGSCTTNGPGHVYIAGDTCMVNVTLAPRYAGLRSGAVQLFNVENDVLATVPIYGVGTGPQIGFASIEQVELGRGLGQTSGVAVDGVGDVFISDVTNGRVVEVPADGGPEIPVATGLDQPGQIVVDGAGDVFIANTLGGHVVELPAGSAISADYGVFGEPAGVAVDGAGNLFVSDLQDNTVSMVKPNNAVELTVVTGLNQPTGIAVDVAGNLFIANSGAGNVLKLPAGGGALITVGSGFSKPEGVAVDNAGDVFVADAGNDSLFEVPGGGGAQILLGEGFNAPTAVAVDAAGNIFVADSKNNRVIELPFSRPPSLNFSSGGGTQTVTIENIGNLPLALPGLEQETNPAISDSSFTLNTTGATDCAVVTASAAIPGTLTPGFTCDFPITFSPTNGGTQSGTLVLTDNSLTASPTSFTSQTIPLSGTANANLPDITWGTPAAIAFGAALSATQLNATANVAGTFTYSPVSGTVLGVGTHTLSVTFNPTNTISYTTASTTVTLTVNKAVPAITWATPAAMTYGTDLSATQLDATSPVAGNFVYEPPAGTGLTPGSQTLSVTFTPTNTTDYSTATASVQLTVNKDSQTISFTQPTSPLAYPVSPITLSAAGGASGNPVTFSIVSGPGTLGGTNNDVLTATAPGTIVVAANQAGNAFYAAGAQVTRSVVVTGSSATLTSPTPSSTLAGGPVTFTWTPANGATGYAVWAGSTGSGSDNLYYSGQKASTVTSLTVSGLPVNGETIYVRLITYYGSSSAFNSYSYTSATGGILTTPTPSGTLPGPSVTLGWTAGAGATGYALWIGSTGPGSDNLYYSGEQASAVTSIAVKNLPVNGETIYVRLITYYGSSNSFINYTYTAATAAVLTTPTPGGTLTGASITFSWTAAPNATGYALWAGTANSGSDTDNLYYSGEKASIVTSLTVSGLPVNGETIYVRLITYYGSASTFTTYTYTAD